MCLKLKDEFLPQLLIPLQMNQLASVMILLKKKSFYYLKDLFILFFSQMYFFKNKKKRNDESSTEIEYMRVIQHMCEIISWDGAQTTDPNTVGA